MAKALAIALVATLLTACAGGSGPTIQSGNNNDYWKNYGKTHGADANGGT